MMLKHARNFPCGEAKRQRMKIPHIRDHGCRVLAHPIIVGLFGEALLLRGQEWMAQLEAQLKLELEAEEREAG